MAKLPLSYYHHEDVVFMAKDLLGKTLLTNIDGIITGGIITETEAYCETEKGCHAFSQKKTPRTEVMFESGGKAYVYFCYGMHHLFNIVTGRQHVAQAVLIRAIHPIQGIPTILQRRNASRLTTQLCNGPGKVCQALGITKAQYGLHLNGDTVWVEKTKGINVNEKDILVTPRIGIDYAGDDALLPWRFIWKMPVP